MDFYGKTLVILVVGILDNNLAGNLLPARLKKKKEKGVDAKKKNLVGFMNELWVDIIILIYFWKIC